MQNQKQNAEARHNTLGYMNTINKLRDQLDQLKTGALHEEKRQANLIRILFAVIAVMLAALLILLRRINKS